VIVPLLKIPPKKPTEATTLTFFQKFDVLGTLLLIPWVVSLLLAIFWGGVSYQWSDWRIILLLCIFGVVFVTWVYVQIREGDNATVPSRIITQRSMACACWLTFTVFSLLFILVYYIPIWFQAVKNVSAYQSGINLLAATAALSLTTIASGFIVLLTLLASIQISNRYGFAD
jgi:hypothetical protein